MSISGLIMQQLSQNKFISPTTAGTIDSAQLGILFSLIVFPAASTIIKMLLSFLFALAGSLLFHVHITKDKNEEYGNHSAARYNDGQYHRFSQQFLCLPLQSRPEPVFLDAG